MGTNLKYEKYVGILIITGETGKTWGSWSGKGTWFWRPQTSWGKIECWIQSQSGGEANDKAYHSLQ